MQNIGEKMTNNKSFKNLPFLITVFVDIVLILAVVFLMNHVTKLLESDAQINLTEIVTQNKDVITSKLKLEVNNLELAADQISDGLSQSKKVDTDTLQSVYMQYVSDKNEKRVFVASKDGTACFSGERKLDISGRQYFRRALSGIQNISDRLVSRINGQDTFVISVPLKYKGDVIGTVQKEYTPEEMYKICSVSLFSEKGSMYIINSEGYVLISSQGQQYSKESENYYRMVYLDNPEQSAKLQKDIKNNTSGFMETQIEGKKLFSAYTAIEEIYDWYVITSVDTKAVFPNAQIVIKLFYVILLAVVIFFTLSIFYYLRLKNRQQSKMEEIAFVDSITGGDTYAKFYMDMEDILQNSQEKQYYILTFDIDNFKYINSFYGFDAGDRILKSICERYTEKLHEDERVARVYTDHFVMLLGDASEDRLEKFTNSDFNLDDITVYLSAGLYPIANKEESLSLMMDKANLAARKIKGKRYKRIAIYSEEFDKQLMQSEQMKRDVEVALKNNEIVPFFQPKVDINTGTVVGAEALARWKSPSDGLIPPGQFIPVCEKTGMIVQVDMEIFDKTLQFIKENLEKGVKCTPISVNFSKMHLLNKEFAAGIFTKLKKYNVPANLIEIELTETVIFDNFQVMNNLIHLLHENNVQISMDDFGTGYSSLHMLKDINIDVLKIDRGFLKGTADSDRQKAIFGAIVQMAKKLEMKVVVEGVETLENIQLMQEFGCSIAQGFYYSKPLDKEEFAKCYEEGKVC